MKFILSPVCLVSLLALAHADNTDDFSLRGADRSNYPDLNGTPMSDCYDNCYFNAGGSSDECYDNCVKDPTYVKPPGSNYHPDLAGWDDGRDDPNDPDCFKRCMAVAEWWQSPESYCKGRCVVTPTAAPTAAVAAVCLKNCVVHWAPFAAMLDNTGNTPESWCELLCKNPNYDPAKNPGKTDVAES